MGDPVNFRSGVNVGYVQNAGTTSLGKNVNPVVYVFQAGAPGSTAGGPATVQMRVWDSAHATYESAVGAGQWGKTALLSLAATGCNELLPPPVPVDLKGLFGSSGLTLFGPNGFSVSSAKSSPEGTFQCDFASQPGSRLDVLTSTNLTDWVLLTTLTNDTGTVLFTDPATNMSQRFYRVRQP